MTYNAVITTERVSLLRWHEGDRVRRQWGITLRFCLLQAAAIVWLN